IAISAVFARPSRAFHQALLLAGTAGFGCAIGTHFVEGYLNPVHLAPAFAGLVLFLVGIGCELWGAGAWANSSPGFAGMLAPRPNGSKTRSTSCPIRDTRRDD